MSAASNMLAFFPTAPLLMAGMACEFGVLAMISDALLGTS
jgi:hypothetical protein